MSFIHLPVFAIGSLFVAAPILLHLMMRRKPRPLVFPAMRFVKKRQVVNQRRMQLRHWALLALRCLAVLATAVALARPIVASAAMGLWLLIGCLAVALFAVVGLLYLALQRGGRTLLANLLSVAALLLCVGLAALIWQASTAESNNLPLVDAEAPVAAVLLFDSSPRMGLVKENKTRLEVAQDLAKWLLRQLPRDSQIAIMDTHIGGSAFAVDRTAAATEINGLEVSFTVQPIPRMIEAATLLLAEAEEERREIYIFTDLTARSWRSDDTPALTESLAQPEAPLIYLLDVGEPLPRNLSLASTTLSSQHIARNAPLRVTTELKSQGLAGTRNVELLIESPDPTLPMIVDGKAILPAEKIRGQRELTVAADESAIVDFSVSGLDVGMHHGQVRVRGGDGLSVDDTQYFSLEVHPAWPVLVVAGPGAQPRFLVDALAPNEFRLREQAMFRCQVQSPDELENIELSDFAAIALLDPPPLKPALWSSLYDFVEAGGGLGVFLGRNAQMNQLNAEEAQRVLPATVSRIWRAGTEDILLALGPAQHPILRVLEPLATSIPWTEFPIQRHWQVEQVAPQGQVVMRYGHGPAALVEGTLGAGKVVMMTTPISDPLNVRGRPAWNRGTDSWPFVVLVNEIYKYLVQGSDAKLNYEIGQTVSLAYRPRDPDRYQMFHPRGNWQEVVVTNREFSIPFADVPGTYRLKSSPPGAPSRGFSINLADGQTRLDRIGGERLDEILGQGKYQLARDQAGLNRRIGVARRGHEFYPWAVLLVVFVLALEHLLSNRFYGFSDAVATPHPAA